MGNTLKKFEIKNFRNIKNLEFEYTQGKVNMIYGISGSGKTTITKAITHPLDTLDNSENLPFEDSQAKPEINAINGNPDVFELYNSDSINEFIFERTGKNIYNVLYDEDRRLKRLKVDLINLQKKYLNEQIFHVTDTFIKNFTQMKNSLKVDYNKNKTIKRTTTVKELDVQIDYTISEENMQKIQWRKKGEVFYKENNCVCPFCTQEINDEFKTIIENFLNCMPDSIIKIIENVPLLTDLKIKFNVNNIHSNEGRRVLKSELEEVYKTYDEICSIKNILSTDISTHDDSTLLSFPNLSQKTIDLFTDSKIDIKAELSIFEKKLSSYLNLKNIYYEAFKDMIQQNIEDINKNLKHFDIPYHFKKNSIANLNEGYILSYKGMNDNHSNHLSEGEKSVVSLVLFLYGNKNKNLIIDDPVSSFDEYRRDKMMEFLCKYCKNETIIILSHDQIFLKFLLKSKNKSKIGKIVHFENNAFKQKLKICEKDSIGTINKFIVERLTHSTDYLQKILNLRLLFEITNPESIEYCYLSGILHNFKEYESPLNGKNIYIDLANHLNNENRLQAMLKKSGLTYDNNCILERDILEKISQYVKNYTSFDFTLEPFSKENILKNSIENYSIFEKICFAREFFNATNTDLYQNEINEINSIIHFNYSMIHVLNPYKFNYYSNSVYSKLKEKQNDIINFFKN